MCLRHRETSPKEAMHRNSRIGEKNSLAVAIMRVFIGVTSPRASLARIECNVCHCWLLVTICRDVHHENTSKRCELSEEMRGRKIKLFLISMVETVELMAYLFQADINDRSCTHS